MQLLRAGAVLLLLLACGCARQDIPPATAAPLAGHAGEAHRLVRQAYALWKAAATTEHFIISHEPT